MQTPNYCSDDRALDAVTQNRCALALVREIREGQAHRQIFVHMQLLDVQFTIVERVTELISRSMYYKQKGLLTS